MIRAKWAIKFKADHPEIRIRLNSIDTFIASFGYSKNIRKYIRGLEAAIPILYSGVPNFQPEYKIGNNNIERNDKGNKP